MNYYQTIPELGLKGRIDTPKEFDKIGLPKDLTDKSVLDIGANMGAYSIECMKRGASVTQVEPNVEWRIISRGIADELGYIMHYVDLEKAWNCDIVLLLSVTHVTEDGQKLLDDAWDKTRELLIVEINHRLEKDKVTLPKECQFYGNSKDGRSVYHCNR